MAVKGGITSKKKDPTPAVIMPDDAENIHLSKAQYVEKQKKRRDRELKLKEKEAELLAGDKEEAPKVETKKKPLKIDK
jgi:hypothetical protein